MIQAHKGRWAARVANAGLGVNWEYEGLFLHFMRPGNGIWIGFVGEISKNVKRLQTLVRMIPSK